MKHGPVYDPYREVAEIFNRHGVLYVVVGMAGINYYAKNVQETFATLDYDIFLEPSLKNVEKAVGILKKMGFELGTAEGAQEFRDLKNLIRNKKTLVATTQEGIMIELLLKVSGFPFSELSRDAAVFIIKGVPIRVGSLVKLVRSKELANRLKDRQFLKRYRALSQKGREGKI